MYGKIILSCSLVVRTGLHIGTSDAFSAIGAVDSQVVRDPVTKLPIIPGSSLKGKLRTLIARSISGDIENMPKHDNDDAQVKRLFGSSSPVQASRLQFSDCFVENAERMNLFGITEVKAENSINRADGVANPRFIERVSPGTSFNVRIVYDIANKEQIVDDMKLLAKGMKLLQMDYLGGHGSRGSGRVSLVNFDVDGFETKDIDLNSIKTIFDEVHNYELLPIQVEL